MESFNHGYVRFGLYLILSDEDRPPGVPSFQCSKFTFAHVDHEVTLSKDLEKVGIPFKMITGHGRNVDVRTAVYICVRLMFLTRVNVLRALRAHSNRIADLLSTFRSHQSLPGTHGKHAYETLLHVRPRSRPGDHTHTESHRLEQPQPKARAGRHRR